MWTQGGKITVQQSSELMPVRYKHHPKHHASINNDILLCVLLLITECIGGDGCMRPLLCQASHEPSLQDLLFLHTGF